MWKHRRRHSARPPGICTRLQAEIDALGYLLTGPDDSQDVPILDSLTVGDGMEKALTAYLAEELTAPAGSGETAYWRGGGDAASLSHPEDRHRSRRM